MYARYTIFGNCVQYPFHYIMLMNPINPNILLFMIYRQKSTDQVWFESDIWVFIHCTRYTLTEQSVGVVQPSIGSSSCPNLWQHGHTSCPSPVSHILSIIPRVYLSTAQPLRQRNMQARMPTKLILPCHSSKSH